MLSGTDTLSPTLSLFASLHHQSELTPDTFSGYTLVSLAHNALKQSFDWLIPPASFDSSHTAHIVKVFQSGTGCVLRWHAVSPFPYSYLSEITASTTHHCMHLLLNAIRIGFLCLNEPECCLLSLTQTVPTSKLVNACVHKFYHFPQCTAV